jgi:centrin-1
MEHIQIRDQQAIRAKRLRQLLSQTQKNDIKKAFDYFDQGGAGKIKKKELKVILRALGFDPTNEELDKLVDSNNETKGADSIDFQEFMDIMLTKIEEKLSIDDIRYAFNKIARIRSKESENDYKFIYPEDIEEMAKTLDEKLTKEEIEEMLTEAIAAGKLLNKEAVEKDKKIKKEKAIENAENNLDDDIIKPLAPTKKINLHEFKAILTWENN